MQIAEHKCVHCGDSLTCTADYVGGGSHYWELFCQKCKVWFEYSTYDFTLRQFVKPEE